MFLNCYTFVLLFLCFLETNEFLFYYVTWKYGAVDLESACFLIWPISEGGVILNFGNVTQQADIVYLHNMLHIICDYCKARCYFVSLVFTQFSSSPQPWNPHIFISASTCPVSLIEILQLIRLFVIFQPGGDTPNSQLDSHEFMFVCNCKLPEADLL